VSLPMRLQKFPASCPAILALIAVNAALAADPTPADSPDAPPKFRDVPAKTTTKDTEKKDAEKALPLGDPAQAAPPLPSLLPDDIPRAQRPAGPAGPGTPAPDKPGFALKPKVTADDIDLRVRYRKARNIAEGNDKVRSAWEYSRYPRTDEEKRQALRRYYDLLFSQMLAVDRGIAPLVEKSRKAQTAALMQTKIAPTVPNE